MPKYQVIKGAFHDLIGGRCYHEGSTFTIEQETEQIRKAVVSGKLKKLEEEVAQIEASENETPKPETKKRKPKGEVAESEPQEGGENA